MGQCAPRSTRPPSALQHCRDFDAQSRHVVPEAGALGSQAESPGGQESCSILHHVAQDEVRALGEIVSSWSQGLLDSQTARRHVQFRVLRGQSALGDPFGLGFFGGGMPPLGGPAAPRPGQPVPGAPPEAPRPLSGGPTAGFAAGARQLPALGPGGATPAGGMDPGALFMDMMSSLVGGGLVSSPHRREGGVHEVFSAVDSVLFCQTFEEARGLAIRELDLDGPRPLREEIQASFQRKARGILQDPARRQAGSAVWLDLVRLCLFVEVVRHVSDSSARGSSAPAGPRRTTPASFGSPLVGSPLGQPRRGGASRTPTHPGGMDLVFIVNGASGNVAAVGLSGLPPSGAPFRLDQEFLRDRVGVLLDMLASAADARRPRGLSPEEIERHCPCGPREAADEDVCPICLEEAVPGEAVRKLQCGHVLHKECCEAWLATADACPMCRSQVRRGSPGQADPARALAPPN